jgi:hypothetical protein
LANTGAKKYGYEDGKYALGYTIAHIETILNELELTEEQLNVLDAQRVFNDASVELMLAEMK